MSYGWVTNSRLRKHHPTGRRIGKREAYELDLQRILEAAKQNRCYLEINAQPERLDLAAVHVKMAKEMGVKLAISTDAHSITDLEYMRFGIAEARQFDPISTVLNSRSLPRTVRPNLAAFRLN